MANEFEDLGFYAFRDELRHQEEERHARVDEFQMRYAARKRQKQNYRDMIENTAAKVCEAADKALQKADELPPEELVQISAALSSAAMAMQTAEQYAEYTPYNSGGFCGV